MYPRLKSKRRPTVTKKERLLSDPDIKRWYDNVARGSTLTANSRLRRLSIFCERKNITPLGLVEFAMKDLRGTTDMIQDYIAEMEEIGNSPSYMKHTITSLKSWLRHFDVEIKRKINVRNPTATPTLENERVPDGPELTELFSRSKLREAATMSLIAKAGLRPESVANYNATDGLMIKDLPDLVIREGLAAFTAKPPRVMIRNTISKARHQYFTFLTDLAAKSILAYLNERILRGEALTPESPVIAPFAWYPRFRGENEGRRFMETQTLLTTVRKAMRPRFSWRPYVLRAFFDTQLLIAESKGRIAHDFRVFFMGHRGSIEARYTTNKGILPTSLIEEMKESFLRSEEFLDLEKGKETSENTTNDMEKMKEWIIQYVQDQNQQKVIGADETERFLEEGWQFLAALPNGKVVVKKQNPPQQQTRV